MADAKDVGNVVAAKAWLLDNPDKVESFDAQFGAGAASAVYNGTYQPPTPQPSLLETVWNSISEIPSAIAQGAMNAPVQLGNTLANSQNLSEADAQSLRDNEKARIEALTGQPMEGQALTNFNANSQEVVASLSKVNKYNQHDLMNKAGFDLQEPKTITGGLTKGITQYLTGAVLTGGIAGGFVKSMAQGAVIDGTMFDPYEKNLSATLNDLPWLAKYVPDALNTDPNAPEWQNRLRNSVEGLALGGALEGVVSLLKYAGLGRKAKAEIAKDGSMAPETAKALDDAQAEIANFADLADKPKGTYGPDGKTFTTDDGLTFDTATGKRIDPATPPAQALDAAAPSPTQVDPNAPTATGNVPKTPPPIRAREYVNAQQLKAAVKESLKRNEGQIININDLNEAGDRLGVFNNDYFDGPLDAQKVIDGTQDALLSSGALEAAGLKNPQTHAKVLADAVSEVASLTGGNRKDIAFHYAYLASTGKDQAARIVAGKMVLQSSGRRIADLAKQIDELALSNNTDTMLERKLVDALTFHADVQLSVKGMQTSAARATAAGRIRTKDAVGDLALDRLAQFGGSKEVQRLAKKIKGLEGNSAGIAKVVRHAAGRKFWGVVNEVWINAILSNPLTHKLNLGASTINMLMRPAIRTVGGAMSLNGQQMEEGVRSYIYMMEQIKDTIVAISTVGKHGNADAITNSLRALWKEQGILDSASKLDPTQTGSTRSISGENLGGGKVMDTLGMMLRGSGRLLQAEDEFFKQIVFKSNLKARIVAKSSRMTSEQLTGLGYASREDFIKGELSAAVSTKESLAIDWDTMVKKGEVADDQVAKDLFIKENFGTYNHSSEMAQAALKEAREVTFTTPLEKGSFGAGFQTFAGKHPWLKQITPFIQTPMNILRTSFDRAPLLGALVNGNLQKVLKGTPEERAIVLGNQAYGAAATVYALSLASEGMITGGGPNYATDPQKRKLWDSSPDWQAYSMNIGTVEDPNWIALNKLDPHGFLFGVVGDIYEMAQYLGETNDPELGELSAMVMASIGNNIMSKTYLAGLNDTMNLFSGSAKPWEITSYIENRAASFVPYSGLQGYANQGEYQVELRTLTDKIKQRIYGANNDAVIKVDWLTGEKTDSPDYVLGFLRQKKVDSGELQAATVLSELRDLNYAFTGPQKTIGDIELSPKVFQEYNELVGTTKIYGNKTLIDLLEEEIKSPEYAKLTQIATADRLEPKDDPRVARLNSFIQVAKKTAQAKLYARYPELQKTKATNDIIHQTLKAGGTSDVEIIKWFE
jgi:hypothetical protein